MVILFSNFIKLLLYNLIFKTVETVNILYLFSVTHDLSRGLIRQEKNDNRFNGLIIKSSNLAKEFKAKET
jgi:hypothetical protein